MMRENRTPRFFSVIYVLGIESRELTSSIARAEECHRDVEFYFGRAGNALLVKCW